MIPFFNLKSLKQRPPSQANLRSKYSFLLRRSPPLHPVLYTLEIIVPMGHDGNPLSSNSADVITLLINTFLPQAKYVSSRMLDWSYSETVQSGLSVDRLTNKLEKFGFVFNPDVWIDDADVLQYYEFTIRDTHIRRLAKEVHSDEKFFLAQDVLFFRQDMGNSSFETPAAFTIRFTVSKLPPTP